MRVQNKIQIVMQKHSHHVPPPWPVGSGIDQSDRRLRKSAENLQTTQYVAASMYQN